MRLVRTFAAAYIAWSAVGCQKRREPPGARPGDSAQPREVRVGSVTAAGNSSASSGPDKIGTISDSLPFVPDGTRLASVAWRTWIYTDTGPKRRRYGYLRVGQVVDARGPAIRNDGCKGGWYRINPRGFVCIGRGATLDLKDPILAQSAVRPKRGEGFPYAYALGDDPPPLLYFKLPTRAQMLSSEGQYAGRVERFRQRAMRDGLGDVIAGLGPPPKELSDGSPLLKPYGVKRPLRYVTHAGRAGPDSGFALQQMFEWENRPFGITTEHDLIALDNTRLIPESKFHGVQLEPGETLPAAFVWSHYAPKYVRDENGGFRQVGTFDYREGVKLTGRREAGGFCETTDNLFVGCNTLRIVSPRDSFPSFATGKRKWIDISIRAQSLVAYSGRDPIYVTLVSTGRGGLGDPEKTDATARGTFMIYAKHVSATMDGDDDKADSYNLRDVPFVQYFHKGYALHGVYWHDEFGRIRSHGCVNMAPVDAAWLFEWTDPVVPPTWHGAVNTERGTVVYIHA